MSFRSKLKFRLNLKVKMLLGFISMLGFVFVIGLAGYRGLSQVLASADNADAVNELVEFISAARQEEKTYLTTRDIASQGVVVVNIDNVVKNAERLQQQGRLGVEGSREMDEVIKQANAYKAAFNDFVNLETEKQAKAEQMELAGTRTQGVSQEISERQKQELAAKAEQSSAMIAQFISNSDRIYRLVRQFWTVNEAGKNYIQNPIQDNGWITLVENSRIMVKLLDSDQYDEVIR